MIKLERFYSDANGMKSDVAYHPLPLDADVVEALKTGKGIDKGNYTIFAKDTVVEVKKTIRSGYSANCYRDMYRIKN